MTATTTKVKRETAGRFAVIDIATSAIIGCYGGRTGYKWAQAADGTMITEDSPVSVGVLRGLIEADARAKKLTA